MRRGAFNTSTRSALPAEPAGARVLMPAGSAAAARPLLVEGTLKDPIGLLVRLLGVLGRGLGGRACGGGVGGRERRLGVRLFGDALRFLRFGLRRLRVGLRHLHLTVRRTARGGEQQRRRADSQDPPSLHARSSLRRRNGRRRVPLCDCAHRKRTAGEPASCRGAVSAMVAGVTRFLEPLVAVHGGAGAFEKRRAPEEEAEARRGLADALHAGMGRLRAGGSALDAVVEAVAVLEDFPLFNAGRGSALTAKGRVEMDAAVMEGSSRAAGAVACVRTVRNPVRLARLVLERTPHVLLAGPGAEAFAEAQGLASVERAWLVVPAQRRRLRRARRRAARASEPTAEHGTVGAVARDAAGHLAAATSTGGIVNQLPGRVG